MTPVWPPSSLGQSAAEARPPRRFPPAGWPNLAQLTYTKEAITVLLLLLALPWLVGRLLSDPGSVLAGIGRRQVAKVP